MASPTSHDLILSRKLSKMIDNSNNLNNRLSGSITGLRERNVNSGVPDRDERADHIVPDLRGGIAK